MEQKIGYEEIKEYILGRLSEDEQRKIQQDIDSNEDLKVIYDDLKKKIEILNHYDSHTISESRLAKMYARFTKVREHPIPQVGQVWECRGLGWLLLLSVNEEKLQARTVLLSNNVHFAQNYDIVFKNESISFQLIAAHLHQTCVINFEQLHGFTATVSGSFVEMVISLDKGKVTELTQGIEYGQSENSVEFDLWNEYTRSKLFELTKKALETYETDSKIVGWIFDILKTAEESQSSVQNNLNSEFLEKSMSSLSYAASSTPNLDFQENAKIVYDDDELRVSIRIDVLGLEFQLAFADNKPVLISSLEFVFENGEHFAVVDIPLLHGSAKYTLTDKKTLRYLTQHAFCLNFDTSKNYSINLDFRR